MSELQIQMIPVFPKEGLGDVAKAFTVMSNAVRDQSAEGVRFMSVYPAAPGGSSYRRTGTLRRSWSSRMTSGGSRIEGIIGSNAGTAPYNAAVQGESQMPVFRNIGWRTTEDLQRVIDKDFPKRVQDMIDDVFK